MALECFGNGRPDSFIFATGFYTVVAVPSGYVPLVFLTPSGRYSLSLCIGLAVHINNSNNNKTYYHYNFTLLRTPPECILYQKGQIIHAYIEARWRCACCYTHPRMLKVVLWPVSGHSLMVCISQD